MADYSPEATARKIAEALLAGCSSDWVPDAADDPDLLERLTVDLADVIREGLNDTWLDWQFENVTSTGGLIRKWAPA